MEIKTIARFIKQTNRLLNWRIIVFWVLFVFLVEYGVTRIFDIVAIYEPPDIIPILAAPYQPMTSEALPFEVAKSIAVFAIVFLYGVYRGRLFQPFQDPCRSWLTRSPWKTGQSLPLGPMQIVLSDLIIVGLLAIPVWGNWLVVVAASFWFLGGYFISQVNIFYQANQLWKLWISFAILATTLLVPAPDLIWSVPLGFLIVFVVLRQVQQTALRKLREITCLLESERDEKLGTSSSPFGYPIGPNLRKKWQPDPSWNVLAFCVVWTMYCFGVFLERFESPDHMGAAFLLFPLFNICGALALVRIRVCYKHHLPFDRFLSGRFIMPSYDVVFIAPIAIAIAALAP